MIEKLQWTKRLNQTRVDDVYFKYFGQRYREYRNLWNKAGVEFLPDFPVNVDLEIVDACNLHCRHCFRNVEIATEMELTINTGIRFSLDSFKKIMDEGARYGLMAVNFGFSGEPLLHSDLIEMINISHSSGVLDIRLITNGTLINEKMIDRLLDSPLTFLSFSIDAGTSETYKRLKGEAYFDHLLTMVRYAKTMKTKLKKELPLIRASFYASPESDGEQDIFIEKFEKYVDFIDFQDFKDIRKIKQHNIRTDCRMPFRRLAIFADGGVAPCCAFFSKKLIIGNINQASLKEIWDSDAIRGIRESLAKKSPARVCSECLQTIG